MAHIRSNVPPTLQTNLLLSQGVHKPQSQQGNLVNQVAIYDQENQPPQQNHTLVGGKGASVVTKPGYASVDKENVNMTRATRSRTNGSVSGMTLLTTQPAQAISAPLNTTSSSNVLQQKPARRVLQEIKPENNASNNQQTANNMPTMNTLASSRRMVSAPAAPVASAIPSLASLNAASSVSRYSSTGMTTTSNNATNATNTNSATTFTRTLSMTTSALLTNTAHTLVNGYKSQSNSSHVPTISSHIPTHPSSASIHTQSVPVTTTSSASVSVSTFSNNNFTASTLSTFCAASEVSQLTAVQEKEKEIMKEQMAMRETMGVEPMATDTPIETQAATQPLSEFPIEDACVTPLDVSLTVESTSAAMDLCSSPMCEQPIVIPFGSVPSDMPSEDAHLWSSELTGDILNYWFASELIHHPSADYLQHQPDLNSKMREILVDWLHEVVARFRLQTETMFLAVALLDRFLSCKAVGRKKLQLVGCVALLLAAKYEEIYVPEINDFLIISDHAYDRAHVLHMEGIMLNALSFQLTQVTSLRFMQRFLNTPDADFMLAAYEAGQTQPIQLAQYLLELTLQYVKFLEYRPSTLAASVVYLVANHFHVASGTTEPYQWSLGMERETRHAPHELYPCIQEIYNHWFSMSETATASLAAGTVASGGPGNKCLAIFRKYGKERYGQVNQTQIHRPNIPCLNQQPTQQ